MFWPQFLRGWLLLFIMTIFFLLIDQRAQNSGYDWFIQLSDNRCPVIGHSPINDYAITLSKNGVLNEPIRYEKIVFFIIIV